MIVLKIHLELVKILITNRDTIFTRDVSVNSSGSRISGYSAILVLKFEYC